MDCQDIRDFGCQNILDMTKGRKNRSNNDFVRFRKVYADRTKTLCEMLFLIKHRMNRDVRSIRNNLLISRQEKFLSHLPPS